MDFKQDKAIYLQIADYIIENILSGKWNENDRILSVRELAISIEVNPNTVMHTYNYLQEKGILYNQRGIGYFVADDACKKAHELEKEVFFNNQLPQIFKSMVLLEIDINEINTRFNEYKNKNNISRMKQSGSGRSKYENKQ